MFSQHFVFSGLAQEPTETQNFSMFTPRVLMDVLKVGTFLLAL